RDRPRAAPARAAEGGRGAGGPVRAAGGVGRGSSAVRLRHHPGPRAGVRRRRALSAGATAAAAPTVLADAAGDDRVGVRDAGDGGAHPRRAAARLGRGAGDLRVRGRLRHPGLPAAAAPPAGLRRRRGALTPSGAWISLAPGNQPWPRPRRILRAPPLRLRRRGQNPNLAEAGGSIMATRARSAAPISPASLRNAASATVAVGR